MKEGPSRLRSAPERPRPELASPLTAKHVLPTLRPGAIVRHGLLDELTGVRRPSVVSVMAPAGYGKTTLLRQLADRSPHVAYVRLDERDNDPAVLLSDLVSALDSIEPVRRDRLQSIVGGSVAATGLRAIQQLVDAIWDMSTPGVLMLDEIDHFSSRPSVDALSWLAERLPAALQLVVAGRDMTALPLARLVAADRLRSIGRTDLAFDFEQVTEAAKSLGLEVSQAEATELVSRTEGWPIAVYLTLMARQSSQGMGRSAIAETGVPLLETFMRAELLERLSAADQEWLLRSSVLDVMTGPLCDAALDTTRSMARLRALEQANLLIYRLDGGTAYRYHPLFHDMLRDELDVRLPGEAVAIAGRASAWHDAHGAIEQAVEYARMTGDLETLAPLVARHVWPVHWAGRISTLERWFELFDHDGVRSQYPAIAVFAGFMYALEGRQHEAQRWLEAAERSTYTGPMPDGTLDKAPWVAVLRGLTLPEGAAGMTADVGVARQGMSPDSPFMTTVLLEETVALLASGSFDEAVAKADEAVRVAEMRGAIPGLSLGRGLQALLAMRSGDARAAHQITQAAIARARAAGVDESILCGLLYAVGARAALPAGDMTEARADIGLVNRLRPKLTAAVPWLSVLVRLETIRACIALADAASARALLLEVDDILRVQPDLGTLTDDAASLRQTVAAIGDQGAGHWTLTAAELRVLSFLPTHLTFPEIAQRLFVSPHTVKTQAIAIYGKLGVSSRREAIERAVDHGLLDTSVLRYPSGMPGDSGVG
jgi:LuxR family transcriptional regulator, maltose regulon positive regulatory protein